MKWKNIKVGQKMKDGSIVTQIHKIHEEECCKVTYDNDREMICSYRHVFLVDVHKLPKAGKIELNQMCTYVPLEEDYEVFSEDTLTPEEMFIVQQYLSNEKVDVQVDLVEDGELLPFAEESANL